jgi:hypothetical protein
MYDSKKPGPARGSRDAARSDDHLAGGRDHLDGSALTLRPAAMRDFHPSPFAEALAPRAPGGRAIGLVRRLMRDLFGPYRPELHYMRGPGPKWREKHRDPGPR